MRRAFWLAGRQSSETRVAWDDFNRADGALGTSPSGHAWTVHTGSYEIRSQKCELLTAAPGVCVATLDPGLSDYSVSADVLAIGDYMGLCGRLTDSSNFLLLRYFGGSNSVAIYRCQSGVFTQLGIVGYALSVGQRLTLRLDGSNVEAQVDGVAVVSVTSTFNQSATRCGPEDYGTAARAIYDNLEVTLP